MVRMGYRLALLAALLFALPAAAQVSSRPVKSYPTAPSGSCNLEGEIRIVDDGVDKGKQYCCDGGTWAQCDVTGSVSDPLDIDSIRTEGYPWFDVMHPTYGADCDGVTDDATAIQAAITAADSAGGGWVVFPPNAVCIIGTGLTVPRYVGLRGQGNSEIRASAAIQMVTKQDTGTTATNSTLALGIEGIVFDGADTATTGIYVDELDGFTILDVTVRRVNGFGVVWDKTQNAIATELRVFRSDSGFEAVNEAGNVSCYSCETSEIDGHHLFVGDDATRPNYAGGLNPPFQIAFYDSQFERQSENPTTTEMIEIDKASRFTCEGCGIVLLDRAGVATMTRIVHIDTSAVLTRLRDVGINNQAADPNDSQIAIVNDGADTAIQFPRFVGYGDAPNDVVRSNAQTRVESPTEGAAFCTTFATCDPGTSDLRWVEYVTAKETSWGNTAYKGHLDVLPHGDGSASNLTIEFDGNGDNLQLRNTDAANEEASPFLQFRNGGPTQGAEDVFIGTNSSGSFVVRADDRATNTLSVTQAGTANATTLTESSNAVPNVTESPTWTGAHTFAGAVSLRTVYGAAYLPAFADSGAGSSGSPWIITSTGWNQVKGGKVSVPSGHYQIAHGAELDLSDGTQVICDPGATFKLPASQRTVATAMFKVPSTASKVVVDGCTFDPGITVGDDDMCQTGTDTHADGPQYIEIGTAGDTGSPEVIFTNNNFRAHRRSDGPEYSRGHMIRFSVGSRGARIEDNRFGICDRCIVFRSSHASVTNTHRGLKIDRNVFDMGDYDNVACEKAGPLVDARQNPGLANVWNMKTVSFSGNTLLNADGTFECAMNLSGLVFADNVGTGNFLDEFLQMEAAGGDAFTGKLIGATITGNSCNDETAGLQAAVGCDYHLGAAEWVLIANNVHHSSPATPWVEIADGADHITIEGNIFDAPKYNGFGVNILEGIDLQGTTSDITIRNNRITNVSYAVAVKGPATRLAVIGNTHEAATSGQLVSLVEFSGSGSCTSCSAFNNRVAGSNYVTDWTDDRTQFTRYEGNQTVTAATGPFEVNGSVAVTNSAGGQWAFSPGTGTTDITWTHPGAGTGGASFVYRADGTTEWSARGGYVSDRFGVWDRADSTGTGSYTDPTFAYDTDPTGTFAVSAQASGASGVFAQNYGFTSATTQNYVLEVFWALSSPTTCISPGNSSARVLYCTSGSSCTPTTQAIGTCSGANCTAIQRSIANLGSVDPNNVVAQFEFTANGSTGPSRCRGRIYDVRVTAGNGKSNAPLATAHPLLPLTSATTYGIAIWADGSVDAYDTGTEACAAIGLSCKDAWTAGADSACGTDQSATYVALCHE